MSSLVLPTESAQDGERAMLRDSVVRFVAQSYDVAARAALTRNAPGYSVEQWAAFADLGWLAIVAPEDRGGIGGSLADAAVLLEAFGFGLFLEPFGAEVIVAGSLLAAANDARAQAALEDAVAGTLHVVPAFRERHDGFDPLRIDVRLHDGGGARTLSGEKIDVPFASAADRFLITVRVGAGALALVLLDASAPGITIDERIGADGLRRATVTFADVAVDDAAIVGLDDPPAALARALDRAEAALCAEAAGVIARAYRDTAAYVNERVQFGKPIAAFQTVRHRIADMYVEWELAAAAAASATAAVDADGPDRARAVSMAKYQAIRSGRFVCENAVQLHGAIGIASEATVSHALARIAAIGATYGDATYHLQRFVASTEGERPA